MMTNSEMTTGMTPGRKLRAVAVAIGLLSGAILVACSDDHHQGSATGVVCPTASTLTYANFGQGFMQAYCLRCHSASLTGDARHDAPADHNFDMLVDIRAVRNHIDEYAGSGPGAPNVTMPPDEPRPSTEERRQLSEWLACNAPM